MNTPAKFSTSPLPGDDWETRRTKEVVRNMARIKEMQGFTTQQLADRCNEFLGEPGKIKLATLNGLFAGKRKSISTAELEMFSAALDVPLLGLLYPPQETSIEIRPDHTAPGEYGIRNAAAIWSFYDGNSPLELERSLETRHDIVSVGVYRIVDAWFMRWDFYDAMLRLFNAIDENASEESLTHIANATIPAISRYRHARDGLRRVGVVPEQLPPTHAWIDSLPPEQFTKEIAKAHFQEFKATQAATAPDGQDVLSIPRKWLTELKRQQNTNASPA